jgi:hypothetical protein
MKRSLIFRIFLISKENVLECVMLSDCLVSEYMSVMKRKNKNTQIAQKKKLDREKEQKKKDLRNQLPPKGKKK